MAKGELIITARYKDLMTRGLKLSERELKVWSREAESAKKATSGLGKAIVGGVAGGGLVVAFSTMTRIAKVAGRQLFDFAREAIDASAELEEISSRFDVVFGEGSSDALRRVDQLGIALGRSRKEVRGAASDFQNYLTALGFTSEEAAGLSIQLTSLSVDLESFNDVAQEEVVRRLLSGLAGETEAVRRFGADIRAAALNQRALEKGLNKTTDEMTQQERVLLALELIMEATSRAQGDAIRTQDSWRNSMRRLSASIADQKALIGDQLIPQFKRLIDDMGGIDEVSGRVGDAFQLMGFAVTAFAATISKAIDLVADLFNVLNELERRGLPTGGFFAGVEEILQQGRLKRLADQFRSLGGDEGLLTSFDMTIASSSDRLKTMEEVAQKLRAAIEELKKQVQNSLVPSLSQGVDRTNAWADAAERMRNAFVETERRSRGIFSPRERGNVGGDTQPPSFQPNGPQNLGVLSKPKELNKELTTTEQIMLRLSRNAAFELSFGLSNAFGEIIRGTKDAKEAFRDFAIDFLSRIAEMIAQALILAGIRAALGDPTIGGIKVFGAAEGGIFPGRFEAFAGGGVVTQPTLGLIREAGMNEAVVPLPNGREIPVEMRGGGGGATVIFSPTINTIDSRGMREALQEEHQTIADIVAGKMSTSLSFRSTMAGGSPV